MVGETFRSWVLGALAIGLGCFVACGDGARPPVDARDMETTNDGVGGSAGDAGEDTITSGFGTPTGSGGSGGTAAPSDSTDSTSSGGTGASSGVPPVVELLTPEDESTPGTVYNAELIARCRVVAAEAEGSAEPDPSTITLDLLDESSELIDSRVAEATEENDVYEALFPTQNVPPGPVVVRCSAADMASTPNTSSVEVTTFIDHGPIINIVSPQEGMPESALGAVRFEYEVLPETLVAEDEGALVEDVSLTVRSLDFEIEPLPDDPEVYSTTIDFSDSTIFAETPSGSVSVAVSATNARGVTFTQRYEFILDSTGPSLSIASPSDGAVVGGTVGLTIQAEDDGSGVDWDTLVVNLNNQSFPYDAEGPWTLGADRVTFEFESGSVTGSVVQINVNVRVQDSAGNESSASTLLYRDEYSPLVSMDPVAFRDSRVSGGTPQCSLAFDPLGLAVGHAQDVKNLGLYRALVWDRTNAAGGTLLYFSGVNRSSVRLFASTPSEPLVIDTTADGSCDDINEEAALGYQDLTALAPAGNAWFGAESSENPTLASQNAMPEDCSYAGAGQPPTRCDNDDDLHIVVPHGTGEPAVYAILPGADEDCTGREWELPSIVPDYQGWVCLAVRAQDRVGNRGVSRPIAVCLDNISVADLPSCWGGAESPPTCTDGCSEPPELGPVVMVP